MNPIISVVIPTRDRARYISEALDSVFAQTFHNYEIIIVDDGSVDDTQKILQPHIKNGSIQYFRQEAKGVSAARNKGIGLASAPYIAFLDSDDIFLPTKLEKQIQVFAKQSDLGFVHCSFSKFNDAGRDLGIRDTSKFKGRIYPWMLMEWSTLMAMPCMLMSANALREVGGFDEQMTWAEDLDPWRRIARRYAIGTVPETLVKVRVHSSSTSFDKVKGTAGFERYLGKAFEDDPGLGKLFRRRATAKMYTKLAQNLLGEGTVQQMAQVRRQSLRALSSWPLQLDAVFNLLVSLLPLHFRRLFAQGLRKARYQPAKD